MLNKGEGGVNFLLIWKGEKDPVECLLPFFYQGFCTLHYYQPPVNPTNSLIPMYRHSGYCIQARRGVKPPPPLPKRFSSKESPFFTINLLPTLRFQQWVVQSKGRDTENSNN